MIIKEKSIVDYAIEYLQAGVSVIPLGRNKKPLLDSWAPYQDILPDKAEIQTWWAQWPYANIGIVTGKVSGLTVFDFDSPDAHGGHNRHHPRHFQRENVPREAYLFGVLPGALQCCGNQRPRRSVVKSKHPVKF